MLINRVIPTLLIDDGELIKTIKFRSRDYIGDPLNAVKIFNEKEVDEIVVVDCRATKKKREIDFKLVGEIADECFMPLAYGGGVKSVQQMGRLFKIGIEKVVIGTAAFRNKALLPEAVREFGSQAIVVSVDVRKNIFGKYRVYVESGSSATGLEPVQYCRQLVDFGVGEIYLNNMDLDGTMKGYDTDLIRLVSDAVDVPVIAVGGAGKIDDLAAGIRIGHASAVSAGSLFVFKDKGRGVLINYPVEQVRKLITNGKSDAVSSL